MTHSQNHGAGEIGGVINFMLLSFLLAATYALLFLSGEDPRRFDHAHLPFFMGFATAVWIGFYTPVRRVLGLIIIGGLIGLCTEYTASSAGLWVYGGGCHQVPYGVGIPIHAIAAVTVFAVVHLFERVIFSWPLSRTTGWLNGLLSVALVFLLFASAPGPYLFRMVGHGGVMAWFILLSVLAIPMAFCMRVGKLGSIILAAILVGLIGEYAGGSRAEIWCWLGQKDPTLPFPPAFLVLALWPIEGIVEYSFSAWVADGLLWLRYRGLGHRAGRVRQWLDQAFHNQRPGAAGGAGTRRPVGQRDTRKPSGGPAVSLPARAGAGLMEHGLTITRRALLRTLVRTPEKGELLVVFLGMLTCSLMVMEGYLFKGFGGGFARMPWWTAALFSAMFLLAVAVGGRPHWTRTLSFGLFSMVLGYVVQGSLLLSFGSFPEKPPLLANLFWGPFWATIFFVIYGASYLLSRFLVGLGRNERHPEDREEPNILIAVTVTVLTLILAAIAALRPDVLISSPQGPEAWGGNPSLAWFLFVVLAVFCFWWFLLRIGWRRSLAHVVCAAAIVAGMLYVMIPGFVVPGAPTGVTVFPGLAAGTAPGIEALTPFSWLFSILALTLAYLFSYTASAHFSGECLAKPFHLKTSSRKPWVSAQDPLTVHFHGEPHPSGVHRRVESGALHTHPPEKSSVNVTFADNGESIAHTLQRALEGFKRPGHDTFESAVRGRKVFIKPNLVVPFGSPYTTDPKLIAAVIDRCLRADAREIHVGEMAISNINSRLVLEATGLQSFWESIEGGGRENGRNRVKVHFLDEERFRPVRLQGPGVVMRGFHMPEMLLDPDTFYINMPKMKTHVQTSVTLGIKNSHGLVPEIERGMFHHRISQKVVDITKVWVPDLTIIDGYDALEGIGPWPGELVPLRALVLSNDVVLADLVASQLMGKESVPARFIKPVDFTKKTVKTTWLGYEQGLGVFHPEAITRTIGHDPTDVDDIQWNRYIREHQREFKRPEYEDEGLIRNIGARLGREPDFSNGIEEPDPEGGAPIRWDAAREFLPLDGVKATGSWGPIRLVSDDSENPDLGSSVMFSGVFGLMKTVLESHFSRSLDHFKGYVIVYGPLMESLVCEGAILFGDPAIRTERFVFAPRIYQVAGHGSPPNYYSDVFECLSHDLGGDLMAFCTEAVTFSRGWYW